MGKNFQKLKRKKLWLIGTMIAFPLLTLAAPPNFLHLTWETDGLAPLDYPGKILVGKDGLVKVSAQPFVYSQGKYLNSSSWEYRWYLNDELKAKGQNLKEFRFLVDSYFPTDYQVKLRVFLDSQSFLEKEIIIPSLSPRVVIQPIEGVFSKEKGFLEITSPEIKFKAKFYFFPNSSLENLKIKWYLDNRLAPSDLVKDENLVLSSKENVSKIKVFIEDSLDSLIRAVEEINVKFLNL